LHPLETALKYADTNTYPQTKKAAPEGAAFLLLSSLAADQSRKINLGVL
jgi:hypothetical protein